MTKNKDEVATEGQAIFTLVFAEFSFRDCVLLQATSLSSSFDGKWLSCTKQQISLLEGWDLVEGTTALASSLVVPTLLFVEKQSY
ncbi:hypothetical protein O6P43_000274 [Quillaja saponaria]|uniref:Uncharacterized protein n=1 Tax=Quillaja saponaria TaxID=32244 RepID=A0AAD7QG94_QUISA|nr:hypothetical protein O6P43_000274 [Quillaja saponaria]